MANIKHIKELIEEIDLCIEILGYRRETSDISEKDLEFIYRSEVGWNELSETMEDGYEEHLRYGVAFGDREDERK